MKNEQTIKSILEAIEKAVDKQNTKPAPQPAKLQENAIVDALHHIAQMWNDATPYVSGEGNQLGLTHAQAFRITVGVILGVGGGVTVGANWDRIKAVLSKSVGKLKTIIQALKGLKGAKTAEEAQSVMAQYGADAGSINEARSYALNALFESTVDKATFKQVSKGEGKGGAKQDNEIKGKKPSEKKTGEDAEDWKDVDPKTETAFGSKPTEKKPQDASKANFKQASDGASKAKKIDTKPSFGKVNAGGVKGGAKSNVDDVKKK